MGFISGESDAGGVMLIVTLSSVAREIVPAGVETLAVFSVSALEATIGEKNWKIMKERVKKEKSRKSLVDKTMER